MIHYLRLTILSLLSAPLVVFGLVAATGCDDGDDDDGNSAVKLGVGAECAGDTDCDDDQKCLSFKGGYCGLEGCASDHECPSGSACVAHDDGSNYCFLVCDQKAECNVHRPVDSEANCSASIDFVDPNTTANKACVPPSSSGVGGAGGAPSGSGTGGA
ncbi:MAG: hypothetical protein JRI68_19090 [Deltaproteobacteria bacterium]|nr:hypothetical protein [Deltaproteobacteria bacterium]